MRRDEGRKAHRDLSVLPEGAKAVLTVRWINVGLGFCLFLCKWG